MNGVFVHQQVKALRELGVECHVLLLYGWYPPFNLHKVHPHWQQGFEQKQSFFDEYEGVKIHHVPVKMRKPDRFFKDNYYGQAAKAIVQYISNNKALAGADWLYAHFFISEGYIASLTAEKLGLKLAVIARGDDIHAWPNQNRELQPLLHHVIRQADMLLANSGGLAKDTEDWMEAANRRQVEVVYNGIDYHKFHPSYRKQRTETLGQYNLEVDTKYLVCIALPVALKGWLELLKAISLVSDKLAGWKLLMVAPERHNSDRLDLQQIARELNISHLVHYMGQIHPEDIARLLCATDIFVLPSYNEGMANSLLEAMACGLSCIATNVGGHSEVVQDGVTGVLIPSKSEKRLAEAIEMLVADEAMRDRLGHAARERMIEFGDYKDNARKLLNILEQYSKEE